MEVLACQTLVTRLCRANSYHMFDSLQHLGISENLGTQHGATYAVSGVSGTPSSEETHHTALMWQPQSGEGNL